VEMENKNERLRTSTNPARRTCYVPTPSSNFRLH
jgi:hypothetical protein